MNYEFKTNFKNAAFKELLLASCDKDWSFLEKAIIAHPPLLYALWKTSAKNPQYLYDLEGFWYNKNNKLDLNDREALRKVFLEHGISDKNALGFIDKLFKVEEYLWWSLKRQVRAPRWVETLMLFELKTGFPCLRILKYFAGACFAVVSSIITLFAIYISN